MAASPCVSSVSIPAMFALVAIALTAATAPVADAFVQRGNVQRGNGRLRQEMVYRGSGRFDAIGSAHGLLAYRGSGRFGQGIGLAYRGSGRGVKVA